MIKKLTLITILLLGNIAFSQEPKLIEKYLFATLKGKIDGKYDITMNIQIFDVYSLAGGMTTEIMGNYYYDIFEKNIYLSGYIDNNSIIIGTEGDEVFTFELDEATSRKILELKNSSDNITINGTWENKSKKFSCVINSVSPLGGKLSEMFEYSISGSEYDYKNILYSPLVNVSYFDNDIKKIDIKNLKNIYERKLKKVINNETYNYSNCSSEITYFDDKILCVKDFLTSSSIEDLFVSSEDENLEDLSNSSKPADFYDCNIISLESGKKINNTLEDLVYYDDLFIEFLTQEYKEYIEKQIEYENRMRDLFKNLYKDLDIPENEQTNDFNFPESKFNFPDDFDLPEDINKSKFIFNNDGTIDIYNYGLSKHFSDLKKTKIEMKKLKPYIKKDSFYKYLFD